MAAMRFEAAPIELSDDARFAGRVRRLASVSVVALGIVWWLAASEVSTPGWAAGALLAGWWSMPLLLVVSLFRPAFRPLLVLPSTLVTLGLLGVLPRAMAVGGLVAAGWSSLFVGTLLGDLLGLWFWLRLAPVPAALDDPFSCGRWAAIVVHVALVVLGIVLAALG